MKAYFPVPPSFPPFSALLVIPGLIKLNLPESCTVQISTFPDLHNSLFSLSNSLYFFVYYMWHFHLLQASSTNEKCIPGSSQIRSSYIISIFHPFFHSCKRRRCEWTGVQRSGGEALLASPPGRLHKFSNKEIKLQPSGRRCVSPLSENLAFFYLEDHL